MDAMVFFPVYQPPRCQPNPMSDQYLGPRPQPPIIVSYSRPLPKSPHPDPHSDCAEHPWFLGCQVLRERVQAAAEGAPEPAATNLRYALAMVEGSPVGLLQRAFGAAEAMAAAGGDVPQFEAILRRWGEGSSGVRSLGEQG